MWCRCVGRGTTSFGRRAFSLKSAAKWASASLGKTKDAVHEAASASLEKSKERLTPAVKSAREWGSSSLGKTKDSVINLASASLEKSKPAVKSAREWGTSSLGKTKDTFADLASSPAVTNAHRRASKAAEPYVRAIPFYKTLSAGVTVYRYWWVVRLLFRFAVAFVVTAVISHYVMTVAKAWGAAKGAFAAVEERLAGK